MSEPQRQLSEQNLNISECALENVQIGGIAGGDLNVNQTQRVYVTNVYESIKVDQTIPLAVKQISPQEYRWRKVLLNKVKEFWIDGILHQSLHAQVLIELQLQARRDFIPNILEGIEEFPQDSRVLFPQGTTATDVFEDIGDGRTLLILGEPGSGKTVTLLKLAESLIDRTKNDLSQPLPVILNLSSWAKQRKAISDWLIQELHETYQLSKKLGLAWINDEQLILLLDGLDEVSDKYRNDCVRELNIFLQTHGCTELVVCSRIGDYEGLSEKLKLRSAICVQPLTSQQIDQYLDRARTSLMGLKAVINRNPEIKRFASTPLILSIMSLTYKNLPADSILQNPKDFRRKLFDAYIGRMLEGARKVSYTKKHTTIEQRYSRRKTQHWLTWLAKQMYLSSENTRLTLFSIEQIQPWILNPSESLQMRIIFGTISLLVVGLFGFLLAGPIGGIGGAISGGMLGGCYFSLDNIRTVESFQLNFTTSTRRKLVYYIKSSLIHASPYGLLFGSVLGLIWFFPEKSISGFLAGEILGQIWSLTLTVVFTITESFKAEIQSKRVPGQGIYESLRNVLLLSLLAIPVAVLFKLTFPKLLVNLLGAEQISKMVVGAIGVLLMCIFMCGGADGFLRHYILRFILYRSNKMPFRYIRFLNYCKERLLLNQVGGHYIFIHRMLHEHFAEMEP